VVSAKTETWSKWLEEAVGIFRTTSPSYPIMASVEYAVKYPSNPRLEKLVKEPAGETARLKINDDWTKVLVLGGKHAFAIQQALEKKGIFAEFCDGETVMFYLSPATTLWQFKTLIKAVKKVLKQYPYQAREQAPAPTLYAIDGETEDVQLGEAENRICVKECGLFPPCTPLIRKGERITKEKIELLQKANGTFGLTDGKITVLKTSEKE
jgi:arginine/lysine/ornithine decarboxylase